MRAGAAAGSPLPRGATASAGLSTFTGEAAISAFDAARAGAPGAIGSAVSVGRSACAIRRASGRPTSVVVLDAGVSSDCWLRAPKASRVACLATVAVEGRG
jgi:hypothetical protein